MRRKAELTRDLSSKYFKDCPQLLEIEQPLTASLFFQQFPLRHRELEFRLLKQITETKDHEDLLVDPQTSQSDNRYSDVLPYIDTRVSLSGGGYINASFVSGSLPDSQGMFLCTQGPLQQTSAKFWQMIWEYSVPLIVMVTDFEEGGRSKCDRYLPERGIREFGSFKVSLVRQDQPFERVTSRELIIEKDGERRSVRHLQSTAWPDHGVPELDEEFDSIMYLISAMMQTRHQPSLPRVAVHCSAGIGRTGTIIGLYSIISAYEQAAPGEEPAFSVFGTVRRMREQRFGMVQTRDQYDFLYKFIEHWLSSLQ
jgi:receptor-type tyrosine-protein phosphatase gamma